MSGASKYTVVVDAVSGRRSKSAAGGGGSKDDDEGSPKDKHGRAKKKKKSRRLSSRTGVECVLCAAARKANRIVVKARRKRQSLSPEGSPTLSAAGTAAAASPGTPGGAASNAKSVEVATTKPTVSPQRERPDSGRSSSNRAEIAVAEAVMAKALETVSYTHLTLPTNREV